MYRSILIANRGEAAIRLILACKQLGISPVLALAKDDEDSLAARRADSCVMTGLSRDAYENQNNLLESMRLMSLQAVLPAYGFLSENAQFAYRCRLSSLDFIGPKTEHLSLFGDKFKSICFFESRGFNTIAHSALLFTWEDVERGMESLSFPVMLKEKSGGGGRGVHLCKDLMHLRENWEALCKRKPGGEAYLEQALVGAKHIEFQFIGDCWGNASIVGARDCSIQHLQQKWIEFSLRLDEEPRYAAMAKSLEKVFLSIRYKSLASIEFLESEDGELLFLEVNPRLQVEHAVTEMTSGIDLVEAMIRIELNQEIKLLLCEEEQSEARERLERGTAVQARIYALKPGLLSAFSFPSEWDNSRFPIRFEYSYREGDYVSAAYDGLIAKIIVWAPTKEAAFISLEQRLSEIKCVGVEHNVEILRRLCKQN